MIYLCKNSCNFHWNVPLFIDAERLGGHFIKQVMGTFLDNACAVLCCLESKNAQNVNSFKWRTFSRTFFQFHAILKQNAWCRLAVMWWLFDVIWWCHLMTSLIFLCSFTRKFSRTFFLCKLNFVLFPLSFKAQVSLTIQLFILLWMQDLVVTHEIPSICVIYQRYLYIFFWWDIRNILLFDFNDVNVEL